MNTYPRDFADSQPIRITRHFRQPGAAVGLGMHTRRLWGPLGARLVESHKHCRALKSFGWRQPTVIAYEALMNGNLAMVVTLEEGDHDARSWLNHVGYTNDRTWNGYPAGAALLIGVSVNCTGRQFVQPEYRFEINQQSAWQGAPRRNFDQLAIDLSELA